MSEEVVSADKDAPSQVNINTVEALVRHKLSEALGGRRGMIEAGLPLLFFTISWIVANELTLSLGLAIGVAVLALLVRIVQRSDPRFVLNAFVGIAIAAVFAWRSGEAEDAFLPGMILNAFWLTVMLFSIAVRWPLVGFMIGAATEDPLGWHRDKQLVKLCSILTWILLIPNIIRLIVQYPLWQAGEAGWLGIAKLAMGWPLLVAALAAMAFVLARNHTPLEPEPARAD